MTDSDGVSPQEGKSSSVHQTYWHARNSESHHLKSCHLSLVSSGTKGRQHNKSKSYYIPSSVIFNNRKSIFRHSSPESVSVPLHSDGGAGAHFAHHPLQYCHLQAAAHCCLLQSVRMFWTETHKITMHTDLLQHALVTDWSPSTSQMINQACEVVSQRIFPKGHVPLLLKHKNLQYRITVDGR